MSWIREMAELIPICEDLSEQIKHLESKVLDLSLKNQEMEILSTFSEFILDSANVWMKMFDEDGNILIWNHAAEHISGYGRDEVLYKKEIWEKLYGTEKQVQEIFGYLKRTESLERQKPLELIIHTKEGKQKYIEWNFIRRLGKNGDGMSYISFGYDITERKNAEKERAELQKQLVLSEKSKALVRVAKGMTHEIANPVSAIRNDLDMLQTLLADGKNRSDPDLLVKIETIVKRDSEAIGRVAGIITAFKSTYRPENWHAINLNDEIEIQLTLLSKELKRGMIVNKKLRPVSDVRCYGNEIGQVILNLLSNAVEAMSNEGTIDIETWEDEKCVNCRIKDSGKGIPEGLQNRIFDLYYSTKPTGSGLGLALSREIIERHKGKLFLESTDSSVEAHGTVFVFSLPKS